MAEFAAPPLKRVRIGFVGVGARGTYAVKRICQMPGVEITALCDIKAEAIKGCQDHLKAKKLPPAKEYLGPEAYKALCRECECDVVYACTPWMLHLPVAVEAMKCGKHSLVEVPATMDVDGCWELVETSEKTHRHCMMLENCCYGETEMLALNMCRLGLLGELVYGGAGYLHYSTNRGIKNGPSWRNEWYIKHHGNFYPTHGLGPVAQYMDINRGDRFDYLVSVDTGSFGPPAMAEAYFPPDSWQRNVKLKAGDYSASIIRTVKGHAIYLAKSCFVPHPYSRINMVQGTKGIFMDYPLRIAFEKQFSDGTMPHKVFDDAKTEEYRQKYKHPMWRDVWAIATTRRNGLHRGLEVDLLPPERAAARHERLRPRLVELPLRDNGEVRAETQRADGHPGLHARCVEDAEAARHPHGRHQEDGREGRGRRPAAGRRFECGVTGNGRWQKRNQA